MNFFRECYIKCFHTRIQLLTLQVDGSRLSIGSHLAAMWQKISLACVYYAVKNLIKQLKIGIITLVSEN